MRPGASKAIFFLPGRDPNGAARPTKSASGDKGLTGSLPGSVYYCDYSYLG